MSTDRMTRPLLVLIAGILVTIALRPSVPMAGAAPEPAKAPQADDTEHLQVSATPDGLLVYDARSGEVFRVQTQGGAGVTWRAVLRRDEAGRWDFAMADVPGAGEAVKAQAAAAAMAQTDLSLLLAALKTYQADTGVFPSVEQGLQVLVVQPPGAENWKGPYIKGAVPKDPWGNPYVYRSPGTVDSKGVDVLSFGFDRTEGGGDDIYAR